MPVEDLQPLGTAMVNPMSFRRIESKFLVLRKNSEALLELLSRHAAPCFPRHDTRFNRIESTYFDTPNLEIFRTHFHLTERRFKLRTRRYAPNGIWDDASLFLELKTKHLELTEKVRIRLGVDDYESLLRNSDWMMLSQALRQRNAEVEFRDFLKHLQQVNTTIHQLQLRPVSRITYLRREFEAQKVRITLDDEARFEILDRIPPQLATELGQGLLGEAGRDLHKRFSGRDLLILEIKHQGMIPTWMEAFLKRHDITEVRFSKYCYSVCEHLNRLRATSRA